MGVNFRYHSAIDDWSLLLDQTLSIIARLRRNDLGSINESADINVKEISTALWAIWICRYHLLEFWCFKVERLGIYDIPLFINAIPEM